MVYGPHLIQQIKNRTGKFGIFIVTSQVEHLHINLHTAATNAVITQQKEIVITENTHGHKVGLTLLAARKVIYFIFTQLMGMLTATEVIGLLLKWNYILDINQRKHIRYSNMTLGYNGTAFEPIDEYKGDLARSYFYMSTRYESEDAGWTSIRRNQFIYHITLASKCVN
jgi:hypothetical protein